MKVGLFSRIGPPLPTAAVHDRVAVGIFARPFPLLSRHRAEIPAPATQVLGPALVVDDLKPAAKREAEEAQRDALAHQRELAFDLFGRVPREDLRDESKKYIARAIAVAFDRSERETLRRLPKWRKEFLRSREGDEN